MDERDIGIGRMNSREKGLRAECAAECAASACSVPVSTRLCFISISARPGSFTLKLRRSRINDGETERQRVKPAEVVRKQPLRSQFARAKPVGGRIAM